MKSEEEVPQTVSRSGRNRLFRAVFLYLIVPYVAVTLILAALQRPADVSTNGRWQPSHC